MSRIGFALTAFVGTTALLAFPITARAVDITDLFNTGVDNAGTPLSAGSTDPHYTMTVNNFGSGSTTSFVINPNGAWVNNANSRWISVDTGDGGSINGGTPSGSLSPGTSRRRFHTFEKTHGQNLPLPSTPLVSQRACSHRRPRLSSIRTWE